MTDAKLTFIKKTNGKREVVYETTPNAIKEMISTTPLFNTKMVKDVCGSDLVEAIISVIQQAYDADTVEFTGYTTGYDLIRNMQVEVCLRDNIMHTEYQEVLTYDLLTTGSRRMYHHYGYEYCPNLKLKLEYQILVDLTTCGFCVKGARHDLGGK